MSIDREADTYATWILPPNNTEVYQCAVSSTRVALTDIDASYLGKYLTFKAISGTVWLAFGDSTVTAAINTDGSWPLVDGQAEPYFFAPNSTHTHVAYIASATTIYLCAYPSSPHYAA